MKKKVLRIAGLMAITGFMVGSFFLSGTVQSSSNVEATLESIEAAATPVGCENAGACILNNEVKDYAPI